MNNAEGLTESALVVFSGLVAEVSPTNLPAGSAAVACDVDYTVASVRTRDGVESVYSFAGSNATNQPGVGANVITQPGQFPWTNPNNITVGGPATIFLNPVAGPSTNNAQTFGDQGTGYNYTLNVSVTTGIRQGDFGVLFVSASTGVLFYTPSIQTITDNLGNTWTTPGTGGQPESYQHWNTGAEPSGILNCATAPMKTAIPVGGTLTLTIALAPGSVGQTPHVLEAMFINLTGVSFAPNGSTLHIDGQDGGTNVQTSIHSRHFFQDTGFYLAVSYLQGALVSGPAAFTPVAGLTGLINAASFNNTMGGIGTPFVNDTWTQAPGRITCISLVLTATPVVVTGIQSQLLQGSFYGFSIPGGANVIGVGVSITGAMDAGATMTVAINEALASTRILALPALGGTVVFGGQSDTWGQVLTPALINGGAFGFSVQGAAATIPVNLSISDITVTVWYTPAPVAQFNYIKTFQQQDGDTLTLALDSSGTFWQEDVKNSPNLLSAFYTAIEPNSFAVSVTEDDREFIALSDLLQGTDMPRQYNGQWVDRISQLGPAAAPSVSFTTQTYAITSITQDMSFAGGSVLAAVLWSSGPTLTTPGNTLTFYFNVGTNIQTIMVGSSVILSGFSGSLSALNSATAYTVNSVGTAIGSGNIQYPIFTTTAPSINHIDIQRRNGQQGQFGTITLTLATVTVSTPVPNLQVGGQLELSGASPGTWNATWTVLNTPNASQMLINATQLTGNVATYSFSLLTGTAPTVGQQVTVTGTANGNGIFNVTNARINTVSPGTFSIGITSPNIISAAESGAAIVNGTIFQFDPGVVIADAGSGGQIVVSGGLGAGTRGCVVMFLTRNGYLTAPSPQAIFTLNASANSLIVSNLATGPPNVVARVIAFTGAGGATLSGGGGFYFWIPNPVSVVSNGQTITYTPTIVNDNTSTQVTLSFTDAVLLAASSISSQGSNNFAQIELGSCLGLITYSSRLFAWGEQNKIQNLLNNSFDGGIGTIVPPPGDPGTETVTYPLGWTIDPVNGSDGSVVASPIFGNAYLISNDTGVTQNFLGMITQTAYKDQFGAPIIQSATTYSVRVTARLGATLTVDLLSVSLGRVVGQANFSMFSDSMQIYTLPLLTTPFATVPNDLVLRVYASNIADGTSILIDRIEPFPTEQPILSTQLRASYFDNFEAFDQITGNLGVGTQNQQPVTNAFELFDNLYIVKSHSFDSTSDNGVTEPDGWTIREISNKVGTTSIHGVDVGEGWALIAGIAGVYLFTGGEPIKINPEIDPLWQAINWQYGHTIWIKNDTNQRKIMIGVPIATPNKWMPNFPVNANPTQPNVVLVCNYKELMTSGALSNEGPIRLTYMGDLKTYALGRKWAAWSIQAAYADFITRGDTTQPLFYCNDTGSGKIYQQITGNFADDGQAMKCQYITYGFPKAIEAQQTQIGLAELQAHYMITTVMGSGNLDLIIYPNDLESPYADALAPVPLGNPAPWGDTELPLNEVGNRFFVGYTVEQPGEWFELSRLVLMLSQNAWSPVRGGNY